LDNQIENIKNINGLKILAVDDDPINLQVIFNYLSNRDFSVETCLDGRHALELISQRKDRNELYDLIILDLMMPGLSGFDITKSIRKSFSKTDLPIIILTANNQISDIKTSLDIGANDFIQKPFNKDEFYARIDNILQISKLLRDNREVNEKLLLTERDMNKNLEIKIEERVAELAILNKQLRKQSITDQLTGLNNRLKLDETLEIEYNKAKRYNTNFSIIIIDIDKFKNINDNYGHQKGDEVLKEVSLIIRDNSRLSDIAGRWGGEEFLIICCETEQKDALVLAEKIRSIIEHRNFTGVCQITASFGISGYTKDEDVEHIVYRADKALYEAKENGRNCCMSSEII
jgi:diguanylate cyclase (GGDEF)-like protein